MFVRDSKLDCEVNHLLDRYIEIDWEIDGKVDSLSDGMLKIDGMFEIDSKIDSKINSNRTSLSRPDRLDDR